jgi:hypothetical protein
MLASALQKLFALPQKCRWAVGALLAGFGFLGALPDGPEWVRTARMVLGLTALAVGLLLIVFCVLEQIRRVFFVMHTPQPGHLRYNRHDGSYNPVCGFDVVTDVVVGAASVELISFKVLRYVDGLCCSWGLPELKVNGKEITLDPYDRTSPVPQLAARGTAWLDYSTSSVQVPLVNVYRLADMEREGEIEIRAGLRFAGERNTREPKSWFFRHVQDNPDVSAEKYKPIPRISQPPRLNDKLLRSAWRRGWLAREDRDFAVRLSPEERFVAVVKGYTGTATLERLSKEDIERLRRMNSNIREQDRKRSGDIRRARVRFGLVGAIYVATVLYMRRFFSHPPLA